LSNKLNNLYEINPKCQRDYMQALESQKVHQLAVPVLYALRAHFQELQLSHYYCVLWQT